MIVNDTVKLSCDFVNLPQLKDYVGTQNADEIQQAKLNALLRCLNLAYEEICSEFLPILKKESITAANGEFYFSSLSKPICGIVSLKTTSGEDVKYTLSSDHISFEGDSAVLTYAIQPEELAFGDEVDTIIPARVLAYGTAREFFLMQALSDEAAIFETRFKESLEGLVRKKTTLKMPARSMRY